MPKIVIRLELMNYFFRELQLANVLTDFWIAGMETTATTLRWAIVLLVSYPEVQTKLQKEIDEVIGPNRQPKMSDKPNMPYTSAVLMELQRRVSFKRTHFVIELPEKWT